MSLWVPILPLPLTSCVALRKLLNVSMSQFPHSDSSQDCWKEEICSTVSLDDGKEGEGEVVQKAGLEEQS